MKFKDISVCYGIFNLDNMIRAIFDIGLRLYMTLSFSKVIN